MSGFEFSGTAIGLDVKPFIIAEMSGNHNHSIDKALEIVDAAANTGAQMLKLQTYTPETMTLDIKAGDFFISDEKSLWRGQSLYDLYKIAHTPWEWHEEIFRRAKEKKILCFSTPFDESAVEFLETLDVPAYKIASFENRDVNLIRLVAQTGKPVIISSGMASLSDLDEMVNVLRANNCENFVILQCTSTYPASPENSNIKTIPHLRDLFECEVGLSDHTMGVGASVAAVALGATVIEKHMTISRSEGGVDSDFSLEPDEMRELVIESERAWQSLGKITYGSVEDEKGSLSFRRTIYVTADIKAGDIFNEKNIRRIRPGGGLNPKYYDVILGKRSSKDLSKGSPLTWESLF